MAQVQRLPQHRDNRLLAALEPEDLAYLAPHLTMIGVHRGQVLYEPGETVKYTYFPQDAMVSLVTVMRDGKSAEMAVFGRGGLFGLVSAFVSSHAFGRYIVQLGGSVSRTELPRMHAAMAARPGIQRLVMRYTEVLDARGQNDKGWQSAWKAFEGASGRGDDFRSCPQFNEALGCRADQAVTLPTLP